MAVFITYHGIGEVPRTLDPSEEKVWISKDVFLEQLDFIADNRAEFFVTFDDGNKSDISIGLPEVLKRNLTAHFFVVAGRMNDTNFLSAEDIRELRRCGMAVGSHGMHHVPWKGLGHEALRQEIVGSKTTLEDALGEPIAAAACPFGSYGRRSLAMLERAGYGQVFTSDRGTADPDSRVVARNSLSQQDSAVSIAKLARPNVFRSSLHEAKMWLKRQL